MPELCPFDYAVVRVVPRVERPDDPDGFWARSGADVGAHAEAILTLQAEPRVAPLQPPLVVVLDQRQIVGAPLHRRRRERRRAGRA